MNKKPNLVLFGIDSLRADHMSLYGYKHQTTPNITKYAQDALVFNHCYSPHIPTTSGYSSMLTGMDCFGTNVVALRHKGQIAEPVSTLAGVLRDNGYNTTCVGFEGNPAARGFDTYINFEGWGAEQGDGRAHKAENLNEVSIPELCRLAEAEKPFFLFMRHMDPHSPYLPPAPFQHMFYQADAFDKNNHSLDCVYNFKPFCDYFYTWFPEGCTDKDYIIAQYDGAIAYMDACIQVMLEKLRTLGIEDDTIVVFVSDHGETLYDHDCYFDHHGLYDCTLTVPLIIRYGRKIKKGCRFDNTCYLKDVMPTLLSLMEIETEVQYDGRNLLPLMEGQPVKEEPEFYITECTWERKHGWRTPEWKLIVALEPDFHFREMLELYNLVEDPEEYHNVADENPEVVQCLKARMEAFIAKREKEVGRDNPMYTNLDWHGLGGGPFKSSEEAYNRLHIGDPETARKIQARLAEN